MADLRGRQIRESYRFLIGLSARTTAASVFGTGMQPTPRFITDGDGLRSALRLGTTSISIAGNTTVSGALLVQTSLTVSGTTNFFGTVNFTDISAGGNITADRFTSTLVGGGFIGNGSDGPTAPSFTWTTDLDTGMYLPGAGVIAFSTGGLERFRIQSNLTTQTGTGPIFRLVNTNAAAGFNTTDFYRSTTQFGIRTMDPTGTAITTLANDYYVQLDENGATSHNWRIGNVSAASISDAGTAALSKNTIMTREKGDARYITAGGSPTFTGNINFSGTNSFTGLNTFERATTFNGTILSNSAATFSAEAVFQNPWDAATGKGTIQLNAATGNRIEFRSTTAGAPTFATRSIGTRLVLTPNIGAAAADYAIGVEPSRMWLSVPTTDQSFRFYGGNTVGLEVFGNGNITAQGNFTSIGNITAGQSIVAGGNITADRHIVGLADSVSLPGITWSGDTNTGLFSPATDVIAVTNNGVESLRVQQNAVIHTGVSPEFRLVDSTAPTTHNTTDIYRSDTQFGVRTVNSVGTIVSNDYFVTIGATGAAQHEFRIAQVEAAVIDPTGVNTTSINTVMTRQKADARYPRLDATGNTTFEINGVTNVVFGNNSIQQHGTNPRLRLVDSAGINDRSITDIIRNDSELFFQTLNSSGVVKSTDYRMELGANGALRHEFSINNVVVAAVRDPGDDALSDTTIITRLKGDARYAPIAGAWPGQYTGTNSRNLEYPIGSYLYADEQTFEPNLNAQGFAFIPDSGAVPSRRLRFELSSTPPAGWVRLNGTWQICGSNNNDTVLMRRIL